MSTEPKHWGASEKRLREFADQLDASLDLETVFEKLLNIATTLLGADFGNVQLLDKRRNVLEIVAHAGGYPQEFLDHFRATGRGDGSACGRALSRQEAVVIADLETDPEFGPHRAIVARAGIRAVQSFPLIGRGGEVLGVVSTHFRQPHRPLDDEIHALRQYLQLAADSVEHHRRNGR